ncbi:MAG: pyridoxal-phosphate dependent enzyme [Sandaracinus sp.]|nr:pyridoxal-phosphate dependent enzyme [Sandaracinus sp.]
MTLLARRFPKLSLVPHVPLAQTTPVQRLALPDGKGEAWVKRDDLTSARYGGNKVRKLEFLLGDARHRERDLLVASGAFGSHHVLATTLFGRQWGFDVHAVLVPQPWNDHVEENLRVGLGAGMVPHAVRSWAAVPPTQTALVATLRLEGRRPYRVAYGGSSATGALGYVEAGLELAAQIENGEIPEPDRIFVALGSGGTAVGLAIGLAAIGITAKVVAVRVTPALVCNRATVAALVASTMKKLRDAEPAFPAVGHAALAQIEIDSSRFGDGYGTANEDAVEASAVASDFGLTLDPTYTARAFSSFLAHARGADARRTLFWHTLSAASLSERADAGPEVPVALREMAFAQSF